MGAEWVRILDPAAEAEEQQVALTPPISELNGKVIGFIDNGWWSWKVALKKVAKLLNSNYKPAGILWRTKPASTRASSELVEELAKKCDLVICGLGN